MYVLLITDGVRQFVQSWEEHVQGLSLFADAQLFTFRKTTTACKSKIVDYLTQHLRNWSDHEFVFCWQLGKSLPHVRGISSDGRRVLVVPPIVIATCKKDPDNPENIINHFQEVALTCGRALTAEEVTEVVQSVDLGGSNLGGSNLGGSDLGGSNLGGSDLGGSDLGGSNLERARDGDELSTMHALLNLHKHGTPASIPIPASSAATSSGKSSSGASSSALTLPVVTPDAPTEASTQGVTRSEQISTSGRTTQRNHTREGSRSTKRIQSPVRNVCLRCTFVSGGTRACCEMCETPFPLGRPCTRQRLLDDSTGANTGLASPPSAAASTSSAAQEVAKVASAEMASADSASAGVGDDGHRNDAVVVGGVVDDVANGSGVSGSGASGSGASGSGATGSGASGDSPLSGDELSELGRMQASRRRADSGGVTEDKLRELQVDDPMGEMCERGERITFLDAWIGVNIPGITRADFDDGEAVVAGVAEETERALPLIEMEEMPEPRDASADVSPYKPTPSPSPSPIYRTRRKRTALESVEGSSPSQSDLVRRKLESATTSPVQEGDISVSADPSSADLTSADLTLANTHHAVSGSGGNIVQILGEQFNADQIVTQGDGWALIRPTQKSSAIICALLTKVEDMGPALFAKNE